MAPGDYERKDTTCLMASLTTGSCCVVLTSPRLPTTGVPAGVRFVFIVVFPDNNVVAGMASRSPCRGLWSGTTTPHLSSCRCAAARPTYPHDTEVWVYSWGPSSQLIAGSAANMTLFYAPLRCSPMSAADKCMKRLFRWRTSRTLFFPKLKPKRVAFTARKC